MKTTSVHRARALAALVAGICVASTPAALAAPPTSDDFDRANLDLGLWTFVNPLGDGSLRMVGAGTGDAVVELSIPDGASHDPWQVNRSVRIMQPADDADFEVEVWFQSEPALRYQMQGVIVEQDADNWLRFEFLHDGSGLSVFAARTVGGSSSSAFDFGIDTGDAGAMRLTRTGDDWSVSYLDGGTTWQPAGGFTQALAVSALGPYVANHANTGDSPGFTAVIDAFQNTASPISPEDDGAPADNDPPFVHAAATAVTGADELTVLFATDEPATGTVRIGTTTAYELGDFAGAAGLTSHAIAIPGLVVGQTYHYLIEAEDGIGNAGSTADMVIEFTQPGAPVIDIWYGDTQAFGALGQAQPWVNILGRVSDPDGDLAGLTYSLNGAMPTVELSVGPDGRRLENIGDFNVDLATADLDPGANSVVITATDSIGNVAERTVTVDYTPGTVWPLPYDADWSGLAATDEIQGVGQVVDGLWGLEQIDTGPGRALETFVRSIEPGYDRLLAVGDRTWTDYEFEVPIVMNSQPGGYGVGVLLRWDGHTDNPVAGWQPKTGYLPLGCILWARPGKIELYGNGGDILDSQSRTLSIGTVYVFKGRVETVAGVGGLYSMKVWELGQPEPAGWDITGQESLTDPQAGSPLLIAHQADASFGPVTITSLVPGPDVTPPVITDVQIDPSRTTARLSWTTDEAADSLVEYGETTAYGSEASSASLVLSHEIELTGLDPDTTYQCRISSTDPSDNTGTTANLEFTTDPTTEVASIVSDEFNQPQLDGSVWTFINAPDPPADGTLAMTGTQASLGVPAGVEHQVWIDGVNVPRIVQFVNDGDFDVRTKIDSALLLQYQEQGIVVEQDADNYLRFELYSANAGTFVLAAAIRDGTPDIAVNAAVTLTPPYHLRVRRDGTMWIQEISDNGVVWTQASVIDDPLEMASIGLYAGNALAGGSPAHTALFDHFRSTPVCPGDLNGDGVVNVFDYATLTASFGTTSGATPQQGDTDGDGDVDVVDFAALAGNFGQACP
jgi:regulation of enolase protein 1 (concanavalin A-like superfamily)